MFNKVLSQISEEDEPSQSQLSDKSDKQSFQSSQGLPVSNAIAKSENVPKTPIKFQNQESNERIKRIKSSTKEQTLEERINLNVSRDRLEIPQKSQVSIQEQQSYDSLKIQLSQNFLYIPKSGTSSEQASLQQISTQRKLVTAEQVKSSQNVIELDSKLQSKKFQASELLREQIHSTKNNNVGFWEKRGVMSSKQKEDLMVETQQEIESVDSKIKELRKEYEDLMSELDQILQQEADVKNYQQQLKQEISSIGKNIKNETMRGEREAQEILLQTERQNMMLEELYSTFQEKLFSYQDQI